MPMPLKVVLVMTALVAAYYDLRVRRIPNWLNVSGVVLGVSLNTYFEPFHGALIAAAGLLAALCIYIPLYALKGMGAGDVKLMAAIGAIVGPENWFSIFIVTALVGGVASIILVLVRRKLGQTMRNVSTIVTQILRGKAPAEQNTALSIHDQNSLKMPHGAIIASGVCLFLMFHRNV